MELAPSPFHGSLMEFGAQRQASPSLARFMGTASRLNSHSSRPKIFATPPWVLQPAMLGSGWASPRAEAERCAHHLTELTASVCVYRGRECV